MVGHPVVLESTLREAVAARLGNARFDLWFGEGVSLGIDGDALEVGVPNAFFREWIQGHFAGNLLEAGQAVAGRSLQLTFRVEDEAEPKVGDLIDPAPPPEHHRRSRSPESRAQSGPRNAREQVRP